ncbi:unnamed protein product [Mesocestoides corti]|uniref:SERPIN domain-containing protein n=2 Tax=Mesocestoides corti TaxID=53468 RepID=A0A0R3U1N1_MESCO|nr:unnamed protein product [Mesocestoides corti]
MCRGTSNNIITHDDFNSGFFEASLKIGGNRDNFVASPLSVLVLLSALLTSKGASGETAREICEGIIGKKAKRSCDNLDYPEIEKLLDRIRTGVERSRRGGEPQVLSISNAVFMQEGYRFYPGFHTNFAKLRGDRIEQTDFNTSKAVEAINRWVRSSTDGLIEKMYNSPHELSRDTLMVLLNAITFKDNWAKTFLKDKTSDGDFFLRNGQRIRVPMMRQEALMTYVKQKKYTVVAKPFKDERFKFVIFLPKHRFDLKEIEDDLEDGDFNWHSLHSYRNEEQVELILPKFNIKHEINLKPLLHLLGIRRLFTRGAAELTGISPDSNLYASDAKQVAVMEVDENGVKAAAVSSVSIMPMSMPPPAIPFKVDQPFYCAIYDTYLGMPLFIARVVDPR